MIDKTTIDDAKLTCITEQQHKVHPLYSLPEEMDAASARVQLQLLRSEHRDLDQIIQYLSPNPAVDQLLLSRLKRKKLYLKDLIEQLHNRLIPDTIA